jgi:hypothetical protein
LAWTKWARRIFFDGCFIHGFCPPIEGDTSVSFGVFVMLIVYPTVSIMTRGTLMSHILFNGPFYQSIYGDVFCAIKRLYVE